MLKLPLKPKDPAWIDLLPGVRVQVRPPSVIAIMLARKAASDTIRKSVDSEDDRTEEQVSADAGLAMAGAYARQVITAWEGIGSEAGEPVEATAENIDAAMQVWPFYSAFDALVFGAALTGGDGAAA